MDTGKALVQAMERIESSRGLDPVADLIRLGVDGALPRGPVRDALRGDWLGHSFHPLLTDFVEGPWMAASFLDLFGPEGSARPARRLLGFGLLVAIPAYLTGLLEWAEEERVEQRRVGLVHLASISSSIGLYTASYLRRRGGGSGSLLGVAAGLIAFADGYAGGHMSHVRGVAAGEIGTGQ
jgi:hypothetical protein